MEPQCGTHTAGWENWLPTWELSPPGGSPAASLGISTALQDRVGKALSWATSGVVSKFKDFVSL